MRELKVLDEGRGGELTVGEQVDKIMGKTKVGAP